MRQDPFFIPHLETDRSGRKKPSTHTHTRTLPPLCDCDWSAHRFCCFCQRPGGSLHLRDQGSGIPGGKGGFIVLHKFKLCSSSSVRVCARVCLLPGPLFAVARMRTEIRVWMGGGGFICGLHPRQIKEISTGRSKPGQACSSVSGVIKPQQIRSIIRNQ